MLTRRISYTLYPSCMLTITLFEFEGTGEGDSVKVKSKYKIVEKHQGL